LGLDRFLGATRDRTERWIEAKAKYRDLSTAAAKCAASGRDDVVFVFGVST
jgi:hypothetical protein